MACEGCLREIDRLRSELTQTDQQLLVWVSEVVAPLMARLDALEAERAARQSDLGRKLEGVFQDAVAQVKAEEKCSEPRCDSWGCPTHDLGGTSSEPKR